MCDPGQPECKIFCISRIHTGGATYNMYFLLSIQYWANWSPVPRLIGILYQGRDFCKIFSRSYIKILNYIF